MEKLSLKEQVMTACMRYLEYQGYHDIERFKGHIIAQKGLSLIVTTVAIVEEFKEISDEPREQREKIALEYLLEHDPDYMLIQFDDIQMNVLNESRGFIKHHKNCMSQV